MRSPLESLPSRLCVAVCMLLAAPIDAFSQTTSTVADGSTPAAVAPGSPSGALVLNNMESINLFNGHLSFHVPLLSTGGRGEATAEIAFPIEQLWKILTISDGSFTSYAPSPNWWESWQPLYGEAVIEARSIGTGNLGNQCGQQFRQTDTRLTYIAPDRTETELRDAAYGGDWLNSTCNAPPGQGDSRGQVFSSFDGSAASFVSDSVLYDDPGPSTIQTIQDPSGYLFLKNGSRVRMVNGIMSSFRDRNGNTMTYNYSTSSSQPNPNFDPSFSVGEVYPFSVVDSIGRNITFSYMNSGTSPDGEAAFYDTVTYPGVGGTPRTITVWWAELRAVSANTPHHFRTSSSRGLYTNPSQEAQIVNPDFAAQTYQSLFPPMSNGQPQITDTTVWDPVVASAIQLPDGRLVRLWYNDYSELSAVDLPTGGRVEWDFLRGITGNIVTQYIVQHRVTERRVYKTSGDVTPVERTTYAYSDGGAPVGCPTGDQASATTVTHYDSSNNVLAKEIHSFCGSPSKGPTQPYVNDSWDQGRELQVDYFSGSGTAPLKTVATTWGQRACNDGSPYPVNAPCTYFGTSYDPQARSSPVHDPRVTTVYTFLKDQSPYAVDQQNLTYDYYNNRQDVYTYDFGSGGSGSLIGHTSTQYKTDGVYDVLNTANYAASTHIRDLPSTVTTYDQNGSQVAQTKFTYDNQTLVSACLNGPGHDATYDSSVSHRGNPTQIGSWLGPLPGTFLNTTKTYDLAGNLRSVQDPKFFTTTLGYTDGSCAFVNTITNPLNQVTNVVYDQSLGRPTTVTDPNSIATAYTYGTNDPNDRLTQVIHGSNTAQTTYAYSDQFGASTVTATTDVNAFNDKLDQTVSLYDGLGRVTEHRQYVPACSQYVTTTTSYDNLGRVYQASNPYCVGSETANYTTTAYDGLNRVISVTYPDNSVQTSTPVNNQLTVVDPATVKRTTQADALGRLTSVTEYPTTGPTQVTSYLYDFLDNLLAVSQPGQATCQIGGVWYSRCFAYDSLKRLTSATNPETSANGVQGGTISYLYDANGNLAQKTDARNAITCFGTLNGNSCDTSGNSGYDALNRPILKNFGGSVPATPSVQWTWGTIAPNVGRLISVISVGSVPSTTTYGNYDALGRPQSSSQATPTGSTPYNFSYTYYPAGLRSVTYPSGRSLTYTNYDTAGRPVGVTGTFNGTPTTYGSSAVYASHGAMQQLTLGSSGNSIRQTCYNSRLQPVGIRLGPFTTANCGNSGSDPLNLTYSYGGTNNNGNVQGQTIARYLQGVNQTWVESYSYTDGIGRLTLASESGAGSWSEGFGYDALGNRWVTNPSGLPALTSETPQGPGWYLAKNQINGWSYDGAGNLTAISGLSRSYNYDAENRLITAIVDTGNPGATTSTYVYDGEGRRVRKTTPSGTTTFVYDASGQLAAEYSTVASTVSTEYLTTDHLGSTRLVTDASGNPTRCYDYLPFGEEIPNGYAGRTASCFGAGAYPSSPDVVSEKFTSKERDSETGLDYFGVRYMSSAQGRFTSPDPLLNSGRPWEPQSWNRYAYTLNNPLKYIDPNGLYEWSKKCGDKDTECQENRKQFRDAVDQLQNAFNQTEEGTAEHDKLQAVLAKIGTENDGNNLRVAFDSKMSDFGETRPEFKFGVIPNGNILMKLNFSGLDRPLKSAGYDQNAISLAEAGVVAHEGTHAAESWIRGVKWLLSGQERANFEGRAFNTESLFYKVINQREPFGPLWNPSWLSADRDKVEQTRRKAVEDTTKRDYGRKPNIQY